MIALYQLPLPFSLSTQGTLGCSFHGEAASALLTLHATSVQQLACHHPGDGLLLAPPTLREAWVSGAHPPAPAARYHCKVLASEAGNLRAGSSKPDGCMIGGGHSPSLSLSPPQWNGRARDLRSLHLSILSTSINNQQGLASCPGGPGPSLVPQEHGVG